MSNAVLPARASLEYLRKVAKERLVLLRRTHPDAQLAEALLAVAREHGFPSWRALKAEVDRRQANDTDRFFVACKQGHAEAVREFLATNPMLVHARERHNATGLHFAAAGGHLALARTLIDAGADVHGNDDIHELGVIGWATFFPQSGRISSEVLSLLAERGVRHHIFSAIALGDPVVIRALLEEDPEELDRRMSRLDHGQTPLHFAITRKRLDILELLIELGADVDATDANGHTPLEYAVLRGDRDAAARLLATGATKPPARERSGSDASGHAISVRKGVPILRVPDVADTLRWYKSIGFTEVARYPDDGISLFWGMVKLGAAELMFDIGEADGTSTTLLFVTDAIQDVYRFLKSRQMDNAFEPAQGKHHGFAVEFVEDLHEPVFGGLQFTVRDPNGYALRFLREEHHDSAEETR